MAGKDTEIEVGMCHAQFSCETLACGGRIVWWFCHASHGLVRLPKEDAEVNAIFGEPLRVLGHDALFEPIRNLLHRAHQGPAMAQPIFRPRPQKVYTD